LVGLGLVLGLGLGLVLVTGFGYDFPTWTGLNYMSGSGHVGTAKFNTQPHEACCKTSSNGQTNSLLSG